MAGAVGTGPDVLAPGTWQRLASSFLRLSLPGVPGLLSRLLRAEPQLSDPLGAGTGLVLGSVRRLGLLGHGEGGGWKPRPGSEGRASAAPGHREGGFFK